MASAARRAELCYWESGELGISTVELARRLHLAQTTASQSVERGGEIVAEEQLLVGCRLGMIHIYVDLPTGSEPTRLDTLFIRQGGGPNATSPLFFQQNCFLVVST
jgi:hypothetical protein